MIVYNASKNTLVVENLKIAKNIWERFRGLLGLKRLEEGEGFLIPSCQGIHTFGMTYPIDVLYLDKEDRVIKLLKSCRPNLIGPVIWKTKSVLELPQGAIEQSCTDFGDILYFENVPSDLLPQSISIPDSASFFKRSPFCLI